MSQTISLAEAIKLKNSGVKIVTESGDEWNPPDVISLLVKLIDEITKSNNRQIEAPKVTVAAPNVAVAAPSVSVAAPIVRPEIKIMPAEVKVEVIGQTVNKWTFKIERDIRGFISEVTAERR